MQKQLFSLEPTNTSEMNGPGLKEFQSRAACLPVPPAPQHDEPWNVAHEEYKTKMKSLLSNVRLIITDGADSLLVATGSFVFTSPSNSRRGWISFHSRASDTHGTVYSSNAQTFSGIRIYRNGHSAWLGSLFR